MARQQPDTGESTASLNRRADDEAWPRVRNLLQAGATLVRPSRLSSFYIDKGNGPSGPSLTSARVRRLELAGVLRHVGVDRYGLANPEDRA